MCARILSSSMPHRRELACEMSDRAPRRPFNLGPHAVPHPLSSPRSSSVPSLVVRRGPVNGGSCWRRLHARLVTAVRPSARSNCARRRLLVSCEMDEKSSNVPGAASRKYTYKKTRFSLTTKTGY